MENRWILAEVDETLIEGEVITVHHHEKWDWATSTKPTLISTQLLIDPNKLSLSDLKYQITYFAREGLNSKRYQLAFWSKALQPLSLLGHILIALAMVVGPLREVGMGVRLVAALAVGIVFKYAQAMLAPMSIILNFPEDLLQDQTYVVTINRNLKDERKVALGQSIQVAFSTGDIIDGGIISGRVYGSEGYAVHLWKLAEGFTDSIFFTEPLYVAEADDEGPGPAARRHARRKRRHALLELRQLSRHQ